jgi:hypothetical protein
MPAISQFFGVIIYMYFNDHSPAHIHASYSEFEAVYEIETLNILRGELPRRAHGMVIEWALEHRIELRANWERARDRVSLKPVAPLELGETMNILGPRVCIRQIIPLDSFNVHIVFDNDTQRDINLEPFLRGPIFEPIRSDSAVFRSMNIAGGTIAWGNGADIDPDVLYYDLTPAWVEAEEMQVAEKKAKYGK